MYVGFGCMKLSLVKQSIKTFTLNNEVSMVTEGTNESPWPVVTLILRLRSLQ